MVKPGHTKTMWLILVACVAIVTLITIFFGLKALVVFVAAASLILFVLEKSIGNNDENEG